MLTVEEFTNQLQLTTLPGQQQRSAAQAIQWATGIVLLYTERTSWASPPVGVKPIVAAIANMMLTNPQMRTSYSGPDGLSFAGSVVRLLPDDMRSLLDECKARKVRVGSIRMGVAAWMTPDVTDV